MSCEVASSPCSDNIFDEDWKNCGGGDSMDLEALVAFNAGFNSNDSNTGDIDPQLLSNVSSPAQSIETTWNDGAHNQNADNPIQDLGQDDLSLFNSYPAPPDGTHQASAATPYFHQSIEQSNNLMQPPMYTPSPLRNQFHHRRSVSEPPAGLPDHVHSPQSQITFTRSGTPLGTPRLPNGTTMSRTMSKQRHTNRQQPYPVIKRLTQQGRYQLRRTQTQPVRPDNAPTSTPMMQHIPSTPLPPPHQHIMMMQQPVPSPPQFVSSRVCTPAPSPQQTSIDTRLGTPEKKAAVAIPVTVEELRAMITEAVQKAFQESVPARDAAVVGEEDIGDEIRVGVMKGDSD
ncbi:hypothetical protein LTR37_014436 [Vermiconidia calcicola]|uniref:Uncharacterized protein n=1 Tax=Vermiconidia calcicola TaxID=1690605 RepID=A0ACC3MTJ7_9PEZI|nr:hypothetical protein LTR37_014436 [Vermiconidia calcicola]